MYTYSLTYNKFIRELRPVQVVLRNLLEVFAVLRLQTKSYATMEQYPICFWPYDKTARTYFRNELKRLKNNDEYNIIIKYVIGIPVILTATTSRKTYSKFQI